MLALLVSLVFALFILAALLGAIATHYYGWSEEYRKAVREQAETLRELRDQLSRQADTIRRQAAELAAQDGKLSETARLLAWAGVKIAAAKKVLDKEAPDGRLRPDAAAGGEGPGAGPA